MIPILKNTPKDKHSTHAHSRVRFCRRHRSWKQTCFRNSTLSQPANISSAEYMLPT